ncbi:MAG: preprotein translocase subunit SecG [Candidatus Pacebacteria bacterium]|nr:preprotein translocase subunit SecG [Candidatus Paceibacterota bacterium]
METIIGILPYIQVALSVLLIVAILMQRSSAGLGAAFGGDGFSSGFSTRRGVEKILFNATIVISILFVLTTFIPLLAK